jgi:CheY-like chemotaxis protein
LRLKQIVLNLAMNSAKFIKQGFIRLRAEVVEGNVVLYVEDAGPGIPLKERETMFTKFKGSLERLSQGTGVGLCLCKQLIEAMQGDIWLDESYDSGVEGCPGARFVIQLNSTPIQADSKSVDTSESGSRFTGNSSRGICPVGVEKEVPHELPEGMSVLFIDDDLVLRKLFSRAVRNVAPDWNVQEAASGETALHRVETENFDLIFVDQYMPGTERQLLGTETTRELRSKGVKSIICGLSANDVEKLFFNAGADYFLLKPLPCSKDKLKQVLLRLISGEGKLVPPSHEMLSFHVSGNSNENSILSPAA